MRQRASLGRFFTLGIEDVELMRQNFYLGYLPEMSKFFSIQRSR